MINSRRRISVAVGSFVIYPRRQPPWLFRPCGAEGHDSWSLYVRSVLWSLICRFSNGNLNQWKYAKEIILGLIAKCQCITGLPVWYIAFKSVVEIAISKWNQSKVGSTSRGIALMHCRSSIILPVWSTTLGCFIHDVIFKGKLEKNAIMFTSIGNMFISWQGIAILRLTYDIANVKGKLRTETIFSPDNLLTHC